MRYAFGINFEGRASLQPNRSGGRITGLTGGGGPPESTDQWRLSMQAPAADSDRPSRATTLKIVSPVGDWIDAELAGGDVATITDGAGSAQGDRVDLRFAVAGGTGGYTDASGSIHLHGTVLPQGFLLTADIEMEVGTGAWRPPNARPLSPAEDAAGSSHAGPQPLSQKAAESESEQGLVRRARQRSG